jgi:branched-chain amino acid transport system permease protein
MAGLDPAIHLLALSTMTAAFVAEQILNGIQLGMLLFLLAAGLTLIFGIMDFVNLAHGSLYMLGAYFVATFTQLTGSFLLALCLAVPVMVVVGIVLEVIAIRPLYRRDHLDHLLATFGLILFIREAVRLIWGSEGISIRLPEYLNSFVTLPFGVDYPVYRLLIIGSGLLSAVGLYLLVQRTRIGMLIRAGASNREMAGALGVNIPMLFSIVFGIGAALSGFAGMIVVPITTGNLGMGDTVLILAFVVIVVGGIGSIRGAFIGSLLIGLIDTLARSYLDEFLGIFLPSHTAESAGRALSSALVYILMAAILFFKPTGLFPVRGAR